MELALVELGDMREERPSVRTLAPMGASITMCYFVLDM
jgi:hypothetical protein